MTSAGTTLRPRWTHSDEWPSGLPPVGDVVTQPKQPEAKIDCRRCGAGAKFVGQDAFADMIAWDKRHQEQCVVAGGAS